MDIAILGPIEKAYTLGQELRKLGLESRIASASTPAVSAADYINSASKGVVMLGPSSLITEEEVVLALVSANIVKHNICILPNADGMDMADLAKQIRQTVATPKQWDDS